MMDYMYKATGLIQDTFDEKNVKYRVDTAGNTEMVCVEFPIDEGPVVTARFMSSDNDNDVCLRVLKLISNVKEAKRSRVMEACNVLNNKIRYIKFYINEGGDVNVEYDFPCRISDDCVGEVAFEMLRRLVTILDSEYSIFMQAMYTTAPLMISIEDMFRHLEESMEKNDEASDNDYRDEYEGEFKDEVDDTSHQFQTFEEYIQMKGNDDERSA